MNTAWDTITEEKKQPPSPNLKLEMHKIQVIRLLGSPIMFEKTISTPTSEGEPDKTTTVTRIACNIIDCQSNSIKVLEGPCYLFKGIMKESEKVLNNIKPFKRPLWQKLVGVFAEEYMERKWPKPLEFSIGGVLGLKVRIFVDGRYGYPQYRIEGSESNLLTVEERRMVLSNIYDLQQLYSKYKILKA